MYNNYYLYSRINEYYQNGLCQMTYSLHAYRYLKMSVRDLYPRTGIVVQGAFQHAPWNTEQFGYIYFMYGRVYLPGVARHHSLRLSGAWQQQKTKDFMFSSSLSFPRGYMQNRTEKLSIGTIDYSMPLCYPDWSLTSLMYLKRLCTNFFCDIARNQYHNRQSKWNNDNLLSVGIDLLADVHLLQINFPINLGVRTAYVPEMKEVQPSLLFSVSF